jgi:hypothetical protein
MPRQQFLLRNDRRCLQFAGIKIVNANKILNKALAYLMHGASRNEETIYKLSDEIYFIYV